MPRMGDPEGDLIGEEDWKAHRGMMDSTVPEILGTS